MAFLINDYSAQKTAINQFNAKPNKNLRETDAEELEQYMGHYYSGKTTPLTEKPV